MVDHGMACDRNAERLTVTSRSLTGRLPGLPDRASSSEAGLDMLQSPARAQRINFRPSLRNSYELRANARVLDVTAT
jgi:hypothetical protein